MKGASGSDEEVAKAVFIEEAMKIRAEDTGIGRDATVLKKRLPVTGLPSKLSKRLRLFQEEGFANVDLVAAKVNIRSCLTEEQ